MQINESVNWASGLKIEGILLDDDNKIKISFYGEELSLYIYDNGQCCCENRYIRTDDDVQKFVGSVFLGFEVKDAPGTDNGDDVHEVQFLDIKTSLGVLSFSSHNEHNGYYGGFAITTEVKV